MASVGPSQSRLSLVAPALYGDEPAVVQVSQLEVDLLGRPGSEARHRRGRVLSAELVLDVRALDLRLRGLPLRGRTLSLLGRRAVPGLAGGSGSSTDPGAALVSREGPREPVPDWLRVRLGTRDGRPELRVLARLTAESLLARGEPSREAAPTFCALRLPIGTSRPLPRGPQKPNEPLGLGFQLGDGEVLLFGLGGASVPSGLVGLTLAHTLASTLLHSGEAGLLSLCLQPTESEPRPGLRLTWAHGLHELGMDLLGDMLLAVLPSAGYRAADASGATLASLRRVDIAGTAGSEGGASTERLILAYRGTGRGDSYDDGDRRPDPASGLHPGLAEPVQIGDRLLLSGDAAAALAAYDMAAQSQSLRSLALGRRRQLLLTAPGRHEEAAALCRAALDEKPDHAEARLGLAAVAFGRGDPGEAAAHYRELAAGAGRTAEERALALLSAARCALSEGAHTLAQRTAEEARASLAELGPGAEVAPLELAIDQVLAAALAPLAPQRVRRPSPVVRPEAPLSPAHHQLLERLEALAPATALGELRAALPNGPGAPRPLLLKAAALCQELGDLSAARRYLDAVGDHTEALHARAQLDMPELLQAPPGSPADLLPTLVRLHQRGHAEPEELRALARLLSARGQHREALVAQIEAGLDPDALLTQLEAAGQPSALADALVVHARSRADADAAALYRRAAEIAQQQLGDLPRAVALWEAAGEALTARGSPADAAAVFAHAGHLHHGLGSYDRAETSLRRALELGGDTTPLVLLGLGHHAYANANLDAAEGFYRRALQAERVPRDERPHVYLRLAEIAHQRGDYLTEEDTLAAAIEEGGGALAWPALAALFSAVDDRPRYGAALLMWSTYESGEMQRALLAQAAELCSSSLLPQVDAALLACDADDEKVRERLLARLRASHDLPRLLQMLQRDVERSEGLRRLTAARELLAVALRLRNGPAAARAHLLILDELGGMARPEDALLALRFLIEHAASRDPSEAALYETLRARLLGSGVLPAAQDQIDRQLALLTDDPAEQPARARLLWQAAELCELVGDPLGAAGRWLRLCSLGALTGDGDTAGRGPGGGEVALSQRPLSRLRRLSRRLAHDGHGQKVLELCESELRRLGTRARRAAGLHLVRAELLTHLGRSGEALGQLELLLLRSEELGPAHALLGMLLCSSPSPGDLERALPHLLTATYAPDVEPDEAGECALLLASLLTEAAGGAPRPSQASASTPSPLRPPELGFLERASDLGFIAVPTDFLAEPGDGPLPKSQQSPVPGPPLPADFTALDEAPPAPLPLSMPTPAELLARAAALLGDDPRPIERQLALAFQRGDLYLALSCCDSLLTRLHAPRERARVLCDKAAVLQKLPAAGSAEPLLHEALALQPDFPPALRALRELLTTEGDIERAVQLIERELRALQAEPEAAEPGAAGPDAVRAELFCELGRLLTLRGDDSGALAALRSAGQLGSVTALQRLAAALAGRGEWLGAADAAGRAAAVLPASERAVALLEAATFAERADDELRARAYLGEAVALGGPHGLEAASRLLRLDGGPDASARRQVLERRLRSEREGLSHLEALRRLVVLCCQEGDGAATERYAQALLALVPDEPLALAGLAERAFATGRAEAAVELLQRLPVIPPEYPSAGALLRSLGAARERGGDLAGAERAYAEAAPLCDAHADQEGAVAATASLLRLCEQRGALAEALLAAKQLLLHLPAGDSAERAAARLQAADLAARLGDRSEAEQQLGCLLDEVPGHRGALRRLVSLKRALHETAAARETLDELLAQPDEGQATERAELLRERAALDEELGDGAAALADLGAALELVPDDVAALRHMVAVAARLGDGSRAALATARLEALRAPLGEVEVVAGLALQLPGVPERAHGLRLLQAGPAEPAALAKALSLLAGQSGAADALDGPLGAALQVLGGDATRLQRALAERLVGAVDADGAVELGAARALLRLGARQLDSGSAAVRVSLAALAYVEPTGEAAQQLERLGPQPVALADTALTSPPELQPWLALLGLLGGHVLGAPVAAPTPPEKAAPPSAAPWVTRLLPLGQRLGFPRLLVELVDELPADRAPAACEPTQPPRLLVLRHLITEPSRDPGPVYFAALRALHRLVGGAALLGDADELAALVRATAVLYVPGAEARTEREHEKLQALRALALAPRPFPLDPNEALRRLPPCLAQLEAEPGVLRRLLPELRRLVDEQAEARALCGLGDLLAALHALTPPAATAAPEVRLNLPRLRGLLRLALRVLGGESGEPSWPASGSPAG
ncbi:MAG: hypothetical protein U1A78_13045 [Polyangia bacterium]